MCAAGLACEVCLVPLRDRLRGRLKSSVHEVDRVVATSSSTTDVVCACSTPARSWQVGGVCFVHTLLHCEDAEASSAAMAGAPSSPSSLLILFMVLSCGLCLLVFLFPPKCMIDQFCMIEFQQL